MTRFTCICSNVFYCFILGLILYLGILGIEALCQRYWSSQIPEQLPLGSVISGTLAIVGRQRTFYVGRAGRDAKGEDRGYTCEEAQHPDTPKAMLEQGLACLDTPRD